MTDDKAALLALADRVEALTGLCRESDSKIDAITGTRFSPPYTSYTASLDAAMTLVPEGWHLYNAYEDRKTGRWRFEFHAREQPGPEYISPASGIAATHALALTAAALRARAAA